MGIDPISTIVEAVSSVITSIFPNATQAEIDKAKLLLQVEIDKTDLLKSQLQVDANEATSTSVFVSGWRPMLGWVCTIGLAYNTLVLAIIKSIFSFLILLGVSSSSIREAQSVLPVIDMTLLGNILVQMAGITGLAGLRTIEKVYGVARDTL